MPDSPTQQPVSMAQVSEARTEAFARLARARAKGDVVTLPGMLRGEDRRLHVRQTLLEDHQHRIDRLNTDAQAKFAKLAGSRFSFFRGTSLLFYRDMAGEDAQRPTVLALGDCHPENFGVMPSEDGSPIFGVNDFDEAYYAPYTWDLKRGAVGFMVAATENDLKRRKGRTFAERFVRGYLRAIADFAVDDSERDAQFRLDTTEGVVHDLLEGAVRPRGAWLTEYVDPKTGRFESSEEIVPVRSRLQAFQDVVDAYVQRNEIAIPKRMGSLQVIDVAQKKGSGTASLGLPRYFVLIEGPRDDRSDDLILELKRARASALAGLAPSPKSDETGKADRVVSAHAVHLVGGDPFYGKAEIDGDSYLVRERSPYKDEVDLDELSKSQWKDYASTCGRALAQAHALTDDRGDMDDDVERAILASIPNADVFVDDVLRFADAAYDRLLRDHEMFVADHALGVFSVR